MAMLELRRRSVRRIWLLASLATVFCALFVASAAGNLPGSPFDGGDGNLVLNDETQDWVNAPNRAVGVDLPTGRDDNSFGEGTKEDTPVPTVVTGSIPNNKSDLTRLYAGNERIGTNQFLYLAWERVQEPSGTTNMDFEFNQSGTLSSNGVTPVRTAGDLLIKYDLSQGGTTPTLGYHKWVTTGNPATVCQANNSVPCWGPVQSLTGNFEGAINTVPVTDPIPPGPSRTLSVRTFGEAAINLTAANILPPGTCGGFSGVYLKSRSSDSFTAAVKDFIAPVPVNLVNCGEIRIDKVTDPSGSPQSFAFTLAGGPSNLNQSFSLTDAATPHSSGQVLAGSGYSAAETVPAGWDLTSATCSDGSPVTNIDVAAGETVTCTFRNRARGQINIHKEDDAGNALQGAVFTLFVDNAPLGGPPPHGAEDTATSNTCTTAANGNCSLTNIVPGRYWVVETTGVPGHNNAPDQNVIVGAGQTLSLTFVDPRKFNVIVLVCKQSDNSLYSSSVTVDGVTRSSLGTAANQSDLCALGGARFTDKVTGNHPANVNIPTVELP